MATNPFEKPPKKQTLSTPKSAANPFAVKKKRSWMTVSILGIVALLLGVAAWYLYSRSQETVLIVTETSPVAITLNGKAVSTTRIDEGVRLNLGAGRYRIGVEKQGFAPFSADITANAGETIVIRPTFALLSTPAEGEVVEEANSISFVRSDPEGKSVAFLGDGGARLYRLSLGSDTAIPLTRQPLSGVQDVQWSSDPNVALIVENDGVYLHEIPVFDFVTQRYEKIATNELRSPAWDPTNSNRLAAFLNTTSGERSIILSDKRLERIIRVIELGDLPDVSVSWLPNGEALILRGTATGKRNIWMLKLSNSTVTQLTESGDITDAIVSPNGSFMLLQRGFGSSASRSLLRISDKKEASLPSGGNISRSSWRDDGSFFEPAREGNSLVLTSVDGKQAPLQLTTPPQDSILSVHYLKEAGRIVFATGNGLFAVKAP